MMRKISFVIILALVLYVFFLKTNLGATKKELEEAKISKAKELIEQKSNSEALSAIEKLKSIDRREIYEKNGTDGNISISFDGLF